MPWDYLLLKSVHQAAAGLSLFGFLARVVGALRGAAWVRHRRARSLPHLVDSVLLAAALGMVWVASLHPLSTPWLQAKIAALVAYILLGRLALRPGVPPSRRAVAGALALGAAAYIVCAAVTKSPWLGFAE